MDDVMTDLYPCKLCGSEAQEPTLVFKPTRCGNAECPMHMTWVPDRQWQTLMAPDWRPIEGAPKDGTLVLTYTPTLIEDPTCLQKMQRTPKGHFRGPADD